MIDRVAVEINPTMARVIINLVMYGRFKDRIVLLNSGPPTITGNQPNKNIIKALVAQE